MHVKSFLFFLAFALVAKQAVAQTDALLAQVAKAELAYTKGHYAAAQELYQALASQQPQSIALVHNLGNCFLQQKLYAEAILQFERALVLDPHNNAVKQSLQFANSKIEVKILPAPQLFVFRLLGQGMQSLSANTWSWLSLLPLWLGAIGFGFWQLSPVRRQRRLGFYVGLAAFVLTVLLLLIAWQRTDEDFFRTKAIIMAANTPLMSSPDANSTVVQPLSGGIKVVLLDLVGDWQRISLSNGDQGWLHAGDLKKI